MKPRRTVLAAKGLCPVCGKLTALKLDNVTYVVHGPKNARCPAGAPPKEKT